MAKEQSKKESEKAKKAMKDKKKEIIDKVVASVVEEEKKKITKQKEKAKGIEKTVLPSTKKIDEIISKVKKPQEIGARQAQTLEKTVGTVPMNRTDNEEPKKNPYDTNKSDVYKTATESPTQAGVDYITEVAPPALKQWERSEGISTTPTRAFRADIPEAERKAMQPIYEGDRLKNQYTSQIDAPQGIKQHETYTPFGKEKKERMKKLR